LSKKLKKLIKEEEGLLKTLSTKGFLDQAPAEVQEAKKQKVTIKFLN